MSSWTLAPMFLSTRFDRNNHNAVTEMKPVQRYSIPLYNANMPVEHSSVDTLLANISVEHSSVDTLLANMPVEHSLEYSIHEHASPTQFSSRCSTRENASRIQSNRYSSPPSEPVLMCNSTMPLGSAQRDLRRFLSKRFLLIERVGSGGLLKMKQLIER